MSNMKCPFCNNELERVYSRPFQLICAKCGSLGTDKLWQELIRIKKQLEIALTCMNGVGKDLPWVKRALDKIKELDKGDDNE